jgi:hypothetical protein
MFALMCLCVGQTNAAAIENSTGLYNGRLRAYMYVAPSGGFWESSGRYYGTYGVTYLKLESKVSSGYWEEDGSATYVEDGGSRAWYRPGSYARVYAYNHYGRVAGVATGIY